jgi:hypothetical protein
MQQKQLNFVLQLTEIGTIIVGCMAIIAGILFLWNSPHMILSSQSLTTCSFPVNTLSQKIIYTSLILLISLQVIRLTIITFDFVSNREWIYVGMGVFILMIIICSFSF